MCDFRKIGGMEAYAPSDNVSELTARINDDGWDTVYANWLQGSRINAKDLVLVFSVGGGDVQRNISTNLVRALQCAKRVGAKVCGVVGRDGGFTAQVADACVLIRVANSQTVTPHTESFQAMVWHLLVSHPKLKGRSHEVGIGGEIGQRDSCNNKEPSVVKVPCGSFFSEAFLSGLDGLKVKIFADGADLAGMLELYKTPSSRGLLPTRR